MIFELLDTGEQNARSLLDALQSMNLDGTEV